MIVILKTVSTCSLFGVWRLVSSSTLFHYSTIEPFACCQVVFVCSIGASVAVLYNKKVANYPLTLGRKGGGEGVDATGLCEVFLRFFLDKETKHLTFSAAVRFFFARILS